MSKHLVDHRATPTGSRVRAFMKIAKAQLRDGHHVGAKQPRLSDDFGDIRLKRFLQIARGRRA